MITYKMHWLIQILKPTNWTLEVPSMDAAVITTKWVVPTTDLLDYFQFFTVSIYLKTFLQMFTVIKNMWKTYKGVFYNIMQWIKENLLKVYWITLKIHDLKLRNCLWYLRTGARNDCKQFLGNYTDLIKNLVIQILNNR